MMKRYLSARPQSILSSPAERLLAPMRNQLLPNTLVQTSRSPLLHPSQSNPAQRQMATPSHKFASLALHPPQRSGPQLLQAKHQDHRDRQSPPMRAQSGNRTGLPDQLKTGIEALSGIAMDDVNVHYNSDKPVQVQALAYAQGLDIHLAPSQERHLPHEAWHVVQQAQGRVKPTLQMRSGVAINDNEQLEHEADVMGAKALRTTGNPWHSQDHLEPSNQEQNNLEQQASLPGKFVVQAMSQQGFTGGLRPIAGIGTAVLQREAFIGDSGRHHMHIDIAQPHYKDGNSKASRINIGPDVGYRKESLEEVIEVVKGRLTESGAQDCYDWCRAEARSIKLASRG
jgi:Domain of unknown function (DUF4157)